MRPVKSRAGCDAMPDHYDLCVIGCGPGGFAGAMRALDFGKRVCVLENQQIGGAGVMWGALASKTMWELAKDYSIAAKVDRGYRASGLIVNYEDVRNTVLDAVNEKIYQMLSQLETFSARRRQGPGALTLKRGAGAFVSPNRVGVTFADGRRQELTADNVLIASGSKPRPLAQIDIDQERIVDSDGILNLKAFPQRLMIIGAGIIGCEYATIFSSFRQTRVYLVDYMDRVIPYEDADISDFVSSNLRDNGVRIFHSATLKDIVKGPEQLEVILDCGDGRSEVLEVDAVLVAVGRRPNLDHLHLERAGIDTDAQGYLAVDDNCCVREHIYAAGDVTPHPALVNLAEMESRYAVKHMFGQTRWPINYSNMSTVMFFRPPAAAVGLNEKGCQKRKIPYRVAYYANALLSRAIAMRSPSGFVKIIVADDRDEMILGMRAAGPQVSNTIMSVALLMDQGKGIRDVLKSVHPHPTMSEGIQECLRLLLGKSVYKARAFPHHINIRRWHPQTGYQPI